MTLYLEYISTFSRAWRFRMESSTSRLVDAVYLPYERISLRSGHPYHNDHREADTRLNKFLY